MSSKGAKVAMGVAVLGVALVGGMKGATYYMSGTRDSSVTNPALITSTEAHARLSGKQALVMSATKGIGASMARHLAAAGASVTIVGRDAEAGARVLEDMERASGASSDSTHAFIRADVSSIGGTMKLADEFKRERASHGKLDLLVMTVTKPVNWRERETTADGLESFFQVNYLSRFVLQRQLMPLLEASSEAGSKDGSGWRARVLNVAIAGIRTDPIDLEDLQYESRTPYSSLEQGTATAVENDLMAIELTRRHPTVDTFALNPGMVATDVRREFMTGIASWFMENVVVGLLGQSADSIVSTTLMTYAASPELDGKGGRLIAPEGKALVVDGVRDRATAAQLWTQTEDLIARASS